MAVALATLPLNRLLADAGEGFLVACASVGTDLTVDVATGLVTTLAGLTTGLPAGFATGLATGLVGTAAFLATGFAIAFPAAPALTLLLLAGAFVGAAFLATTFLMTAFLMAGFFAAVFPALVFFTATFPATFLADAAFFGGGLGAAFLAAAGFATTFFVAGLATALLTVFLAGVLALFTVRPFVAAVFDLPVPGRRALSGVFPFCALAAVELRVVFAISLHRFWPWRPGVIADVFYTSKPASGILVPLPAASRSGNVNALTRLILWFIGLYKRGLSPLLGPRCRFHPSCSDYARIAVTRFGPWRGSLLAGWRLLRCQALCTGGEDPVPEDFHFRRCRGPDES